MWLSLVMLPLYILSELSKLAPEYISSQRHFAACFQRVSEILFSKTYQKTALWF